jgi:hypothetical protein
MLPSNWGKTIRKAHEANPRFGAFCRWRFYDEDFVQELANKKIKQV